MQSPLKHWIKTLHIVKTDTIQLMKTLLKDATTTSLKIPALKTLIHLSIRMVFVTAQSVDRKGACGSAEIFKGVYSILFGGIYGKILFRH